MTVGTDFSGNFNPTTIERPHHGEQDQMVFCRNHEDVAAIDSCATCGKAICYSVNVCSASRSSLKCASGWRYGGGQGVERRRPEGHAKLKAPEKKIHPLPFSGGGSARVRRSLLARLLSRFSAS
jgi:hypothetical protein